MLANTMPGARAGAEYKAEGGTPCEAQTRGLKLEPTIVIEPRARGDVCCKNYGRPPTAALANGRGIAYHLGQSFSNL